MRTSSASILLGVALLALSGLAVAQERQVIPVTLIKPIKDTPSAAHDLTKFTPLQRHLYLGGKSAMEWLARMNKAEGRFLPGLQPSLRVPVEQDSFLNQAGAAFALARASAFFQDERAAALAKQTILTLLMETAVDAQTQTRFTAAPEPFLNRLATAGLLTLAIHELHQPAGDLLQQAEQLTNYLRGQQRPDGSFAIADEDSQVKSEIIQHCTGPALWGLCRSQARQPAPWKHEALRKACAYYHAWWRQNKNMPMIPAHTAAYAEAYLATKEKAFADCVFEMNDWLCTLQFTNMDPRRAHWAGGFQRWESGKAVAGALEAASAAAAESLVEACRVARIAGDAQRVERYRMALDNCLHFVLTLQYSEANTQHFTDWYRQNFLLGGFHRSHQDGNLRIEYAQHALAALVQHLRYTADLSSATEPARLNP